jgi:hypothetical protein
LAPSFNSTLFEDVMGYCVDAKGCELGWIPEIPSQPIKWSRKEYYRNHIFPF